MKTKTCFTYASDFLLASSVIITFQNNYLRKCDFPFGILSKAPNRISPSVLDKTVSITYLFHLSTAAFRIVILCVGGDDDDDEVVRGWFRVVKQV